ncbi:hypothetical protein BCD48_14165 [Pseudofrankia sp. BMG5.36]|nr:hypothetical protein BCD48_14165 [Pseudofrankia sp. BMG5.36]
MGDGRRVRRAVCGGLVAAALAVVGTACQDGAVVADPAAASPAVTAPASPSASPTAVPARQLRAGDYVLTAGPETEGFESSGGVEDEDPGNSAMRAEIAACVGVNDFNPPAPSDETNGDTFVSTEESEFQASSRAKILPAEQIRQNARIVSSPRFGDCYRAALEEALAGEDANGFTYEIVAVETPAPPRGATAFVRTSMGVTDANGTYGYVLDTVYFYAGQVAVELQVTNVQDVPPPTTEQGLIDQIAGKLTDQ